MKKHFLLLSLSYLLFSCSDTATDTQGDHSNIEEPTTPRIDTQVDENTDKKFTHQTAFIFDEHDILNKFEEKLTTEDIRGLINCEHEELVDTLIYSKDFGLSEAIDVEYRFNKRGKLKEISAISYHENTDSRASFNTILDSLLKDYINPKTDNWISKDINVKVEKDFSGNSKSKNIELSVTKL